SPPRICGPLVRTISPYRPARAAASSSIVPAVMTPLPPDPANAIERLAGADSPAVPGFCCAGESLGIEALTACSSRVLGTSETARRPAGLDEDQAGDE